MLDRSDAEGLGRDDPGAVFPERIQAAVDAGTGAEVVQIGRRNTAWYSGAPVEPPALVPASGRRGWHGPVGEVLDGVLLGQEVGEDEIVTLFSRPGPRGGGGRAGGRRAAPGRRRRRRHLRPQPQHQLHERVHLQVPVLRLLEGPAVAQPARHALPAHPRGHPGAGASRRSTDGATEVCLQGGIHPDFDGDYYIDVARAVQEAAPDIHIHGFTALEVTEGARRLGEPLADYLRRLMDAGPARRCPAPPPRSSTTRSAPSSAPTRSTPRSGSRPTAPPTRSACARTSRSCSASIEQPRSWARHLVRTRALQKETGGFTEFVPLPFVHMAAPIYLQRKARRGPDVPRGAAHARRRPHRLPRLDRQHPGVVGEDGPRRRRARSCRPASTTSAAR